MFKIYLATVGITQLLRWINVRHLLGPGFWVNSDLDSWLVITSSDREKIETQLLQWVSAIHLPLARSQRQAVSPLLVADREPNRAAMNVLLGDQQ